MDNPLFRDDLGDLDAIMSQLNSARRSAPTPSVQAPDDSRSMPATPVSVGVRLGRRGTITVVSPTASTSAPPAPPTAVSPVQDAPPPPLLAAPGGRISRTNSAASWLDDTTAPDMPDPMASTTAAMDDTPFAAWLDTTARPAPETSSRVPTPSDKHLDGTRPSSRGTPTPHIVDDPHEAMVRQELQLLAEIRQVDHQIEDLSDHLKNVAIKSEAELTDLEAKVLVKQTEVFESEQDASKKLSEALAFKARRTKDLEAQAAVELSEAEEARRASVTTQMERNEASVASLVAETEASIRRLQAQRDLILQKEPFSAQATVLSLSADTLEGKLSKGMEIVAAFAQTQMDAIRNNIVDFIRHESLQAAHGVWERHRVAFTSESEHRRHQFVSFLENAVGNFTRFMEQREETRAHALKSFRGAAEDMSASLRKRGEERGAARRQEVEQQYIDQSHAFSKELETSTTYQLEKAATIAASDGDIAEQQIRDLQSRFDVEVRVFASLANVECEALSQRNEHRRKDVESLADACPSETRKLSSDLVQSLTESIASLGQAIVDKTSETKLVAHLTKDAASGGGTMPARGCGLCPEEVELRELLREKHSVVEALQREVSSQWESLHHARQHCETARTRLVCALEDQAAMVHEQRLVQTSEYARLEMLRCSWEKEHQAMLSNSTSDPARVQLSEVANRLLSSVDALLEKSGRSRSVVAMQRTVQSRDDEERTTRFQALQSAWLTLYERLLALNDKLQHVASHQTTIGVEEAKLKFEQLTHDAQREEFREKVERLRARAEIVEKDSTEAAMTKQRVMQSVQRVVEDQERLATEQRRLTTLQAELLQRQQERLDARGERSVHVAPLRHRVSPFADLVAAHS